MINRPEYLDALKRHKDKSDLMKVITGVRRCGKSTILILFQDYLLKTGISGDQIISINLESKEYADFRNGDVLYKYVKEQTKSNKQYYVFLDELQLVSDYEDIANSLRLRKNIDLYLTGSTSYILTGKSKKNDAQGTATRWGGRYVEIKMFPLSFKEFSTSFTGSNIHKDELYRFYVEQSSFPQVLDYYEKNTGSRYDKQAIQDYLAALYNTILVDDIMTQEGVKDVNLLKRVINFLFANIGSPSSVNRIVGTINNDLKLLKSESKVYAALIENYLSALQKSFLFYSATGYSAKGREYLTSNAKYYAVDVGLRYHLLGGDASVDAGHILENVVYLELLRRGYQVKIGSSDNKEVDFEATKPGGIKEYYQVSQSVMDENTARREFSALQDIKDNHPKVVLTRDYGNTNQEGIWHKNVLEWLLG